MKPAPPLVMASPTSSSSPEGPSPPHDFDVQKRIHRQIRNDPDYDDWEYGTEPLPHEGWVAPEPAEEETDRSLISREAPESDP